MGCSGTTGDHQTTSVVQAPHAPASVALDSIEDVAFATWPLVSGATAYNVYVAEEPGISRANWTGLAGGRKLTEVTPPVNLGAAHAGASLHVVVTALNTAGESSESPAGSINLNGGTPPSVIVHTPSGPQSGNVTIPFELRDPDGDACSVQAEYTGGTAAGVWRPATLVAALTGIPPSPGLSLVWRSDVDEPNQSAAGYVVRLTPADRSAVGTADQTSPFALSNATAGPLNAQSPLGINLNFATYYSTQFPWVDAMTQAKEWNTQNDHWVTGGQNSFNTGFIGQIPQDADGYPLSLPYPVAGAEADQIVATLLMRNIGGNYPAGQYVCLYDGTGALDAGYDAKILSQQPGRVVLNVTPSNNGILLKIVQSQSGDHLRNLRVILPGFEATHASSPLHPEFLDLFSCFKVVRFVHFQRTIDSINQYWADRPTQTYYTQATNKGVSVEEMVALANAMHADPWFCMPHMADDEFIREFAIYVRDNLEPSAKVYLEYSNEVWNAVYDEYHYATNQGLALGLSTSPGEARRRFYSQRSVEMFDIWEQAFGGTSRLVRVIASQNANPWLSQQLLEWQDAYQSADALAVAPYFGGGLGSPTTAPTTKTMTVTQLLDSLESTILGGPGGVTVQHLQIAQSYGLPLIGYEGGQHLVAGGSMQNDPQLNLLFDDANRHPQMGDIYDAYLANWKAMGGQMFVLFNSIGQYNKFGRWGILEYQIQDPSTAHKYEAIRKFATTVPKWW